MAVVGYLVYPLTPLSEKAKPADVDSEEVASDDAESSDGRTDGDVVQEVVEREPVLPDPPKPIEPIDMDGSEEPQDRLVDTPVVVEEPDSKQGTDDGLSLAETLAALSPDDFPSRIKINNTVELTDTSNPDAPGAPLLPGSSVVPLAIEGTDVRVTTRRGSPLEALVPVDDTDFLEQVEGQLAEAKRAAADEKRRQANLAERRTTGGGPSEVSGPADTPLELLGEAKVEELVKADLLTERLQDLKPRQVKAFRYVGEERISGQPAETMIVEFEADTLIGVKRLEARAVIRDGSVVRWEWAKTGFEMR